MPFEFASTVNPADRSPADPAPAELGTPLGDIPAPENGEGRPGGALADNLDDADPGQGQAATDDVDDAGSGTGGDPAVGDNLPDGRSAYIKRENYQKLEGDYAALKAQVEQLQNGGWNTVGQRLARDGFDSPEAFLQAIESQETALAEQRQNAEIEARVSKLIDKEYAPELYNRQIELEKRLARTELRDREVTLRELPNQYKHADMATVKQFGSTPEVAEAIARHTHNVMDAVEKRHAEEVDIARKNAVLEYLADQKKNNSSGVPPESGAPRSAPANQAQEGYRPGRFGFAPRKARV